MIEKENEARTESENIFNVSNSEDSFNFNNVDEQNDNIVKKNPFKKKVTLIGIIIIFVITGIIIGLINFNPFGNNEYVLPDDKDNVPAPTISKNPSIDSTTGPLVDSDLIVSDFWRELDNPYPVEYDEWRLEHHSFVERETIINAMKNSSDALGSIAYNTLPTEESGYTSNLDEMITPEGGFNPMFSYWTAEQFNYEVGSYIERLINPIFGGWGAYQYSEHTSTVDFDVNLISDMFTEEFLTKNENKPFKEWVPLFIDWEANDYGLKGQLLDDSGQRWYGEVINSDSTFTFNEETSQYDVKTILNIRYTAWNLNQTKISKDATLTLDLVSNNVSDIDNENVNRVLIDNAILEVG